MKLLNGVAVIIDDNIGKTGDKINQIIEKIEERGIPTIKYPNLNSAEKFLDNFGEINFIILDWKITISGEDLPLGVKAGSEISISDDKKILFIKKLKEKCFSPIFIFTNESPSDIKDRLIRDGLYFEQEGRDFIYIKDKVNLLKDDNLFLGIDEWINKTPSVYLLKSWNKKLLEAKNEIFWDLYHKSKGIWPKVLWEHYEKEKEVPQNRINEILFQLASEKVNLNEIEKDKITSISQNANPEELKGISKRIMFQRGELEGGSLEGIKPGDIFKEADRKYLLNIRPECDTIARRPGFSEIYVIKGKKVDNPRRLSKQISKTGLHPKVNEAFVWLVEGDGIVKFNFKEFEKVKFSEVKEKRLCRLIPPYITEIQQRFSSFLGRSGVPRLPCLVEEDILDTKDLSKSFDFLYSL